MKVLFLDIDGVLNSEQSAHMHHNPSNFATFTAPPVKHVFASEFCPIAVANLHRLLNDDPNLQVVISSSWRLGNTMEEFEAIFKYLGLPVDRLIGMTPHLFNKQRGEEILQYVNENNVYNYVIFDDDNDMDVVRDRFIHIDYKLGLTLYNIKQAQRLLND